MKHFSLSLSLLAAVPAAAPGAISAPELGITSDVAFASEYVFRGIQLAEDSFQPSVEASIGSFYAGLWSNLPTAAAEPSEINYYGGYEFVFPAWAAVSFDAGLLLYHYPDNWSARTHEAFLGAVAKDPGLPGLGATLYFFHDFDLRSDGLEGRLSYELALENAGMPSASLVAHIFAGAQGGSGVKAESFHYYGGSIELPYQLTEASALTAGLHYATAEKYQFGPGEQGRNLFWTVSFTAGF